MKLAISNIAWTKDNDKAVWQHMSKNGFSGLEIAPTRLFAEKPYDNIIEAVQFAKEMTDDYNLLIPSMQSIWYGRKEFIFGSKKERQILLEYTHKAVDFAEAIGCHNLVFGCPKNRNITNNEDYKIGIEFFRNIGNYAKKHNTIVALEANPVIYGTNFLNDTKDAISYCREISNEGIGINYDLGTAIFNNESYQLCIDNLDLINHVHISEPYLAKIKKRDLHKELLKALKNAGFDKYISIEMKTMNSLEDVYEVMGYLRDLL